MLSQVNRELFFIWPYHNILIKENNFFISLLKNLSFYGKILK